MQYLCNSRDHLILSARCFIQAWPNSYARPSLTLRAQIVGVDEEPQADEGGGDDEGWHQSSLEVLYSVAGVVGALSVIGGAIRYHWSFFRPRCVRHLGREQDTTVVGEDDPAGGAAG